MSPTKADAARLRLGISTCPNDTFAFHGLLSGASADRSLGLELELHDVQTLNEQFRSGALDAAKVSFAALLDLAQELWVLPVGAALGQGVGPVVLASARPDAADVVLAPGKFTTANLLWRMFHPREPTPTQVVFSQIMPALARGAARLGVCIHEGRFTYQNYGLELREDLGQVWESQTGLPLPLGGIAVRRSLGRERALALVRAIEASLALARAEPDAALATMRKHAQEHSDAVLLQHVELYVTPETERMSARGERALAELTARAVAAGSAPWRATPLEVLRA